jgi:hypothetical protein
MSDKLTLTLRLMALFLSHPNEWLDAQTRVVPVAGFGGFRARISDCRAQGLDIRNRVRRVTRDGRTFTISEYKFVPRQPRNLLEVAEMQTQTEASC